MRMTICSMRCVYDVKGGASVCWHFLVALDIRDTLLRVTVYESLTKLFLCRSRDEYGVSMFSRRTPTRIVFVLARQRCLVMLRLDAILKKPAEHSL